MSTQSKPPGNVNVEKKIQDFVHKGVEQDIERAYNDLFEVGKQNNQLPEQLFVNAFLPFFSGKIKDDAQLNITTKWVSVAGSTMNSVDIINNDGKVLFTVPPLMSTEFLGIHDNIRGKSFNEIFNDAKNQANRIPILGERVIAEDAGGKVSQMKVDPKDIQITQWDMIFDRYNVPHPKSKTGQPIGKKASDGTDELEF